MEEDEFKFIINHVFLPRKLPNKIDDQAKYEANETNFLIIAKNVIKNLSSMIETTSLNIDFYREIVRMFIVWKKNQTTACLNAAMIRKQIKSLKENQSFPLYLRAQNSCIILEMLSNKQNYPVVLSSFRVSLSNEEVLSTTGDIYGKFPSASFYIANKSSIRSKVFSELVEDLGNHNILEKSSNVDTEIRNVPNDKFVNEWLGLFLSEDVPLSKYPKKVTKKIRDEILWKKCILPFRRSGIILFG
jgi:hypothetical protein